MDVINNEIVDPDLQINRDFRNLIKQFDRYFSTVDKNYNSVLQRK